jgi:iron complex outermembrane receptor protein
MISNRRSGLAAGASLVALSLGLVLPNAAAAQTQPAAPAASPASVEEVVVTGSLIARSGYNSPSPLTSVSSADLAAAAPANIATYVNQLPALAGSATPTSNVKAVSNGTAGLNILNLRNLGAERTLVLFDGQRSVTSTLSGVTDVNNFPQALISRVEVVTGGASATYGSDAVAGVVNFILDKKYTGLKGEISAGETTYADDRDWKGSLTYGTGFLGDRGHLLLSGEIAHTDGFTSKKNGHDNEPRDWAEEGWKTINNPAYTATNGQPRQLVLNHVGISNATQGGIIVSGPLKGTYFGAGGATAQLNYGPIVSNPFMQGGDWQYTDVEGNTSMDSEVDRRGVFGRVSFDVTDNINVYGQYSHNYTRTRSINSFESYFGGLNVSVNNPFLPAAVAAQARSLGLSTLEVGTMNGDLGPYNAEFSRTVDRYVFGASGKFDLLSKEWRWDGYFQDGISHVSNNTYASRKSRYNDAIQAARAPNGQIVCASTLTSPGNGCVPYNLFGTGVNSQDALNYITGHSHMDQRFEQRVYALNVQGEPFSTWAGPVSVAFGAAHRSEAVRGSSTPEDMARDFYAGNYIPTFGRYNVSETYLETIIPLAEDLPLIKSLSIDGAIRATKYSTSGSVKTWKISGSYSPIDDIRFRFTKSQDIRAPNLGDLFTTGSTSVSTVVDPFINNTQYTAYTLSAGNLNLQPERGKTTNFGVVFQPSFIPRFSASVDYFRIAINDAIGSAAGAGKGQNIIDLCFSGLTQYCSALIRGGPVVNGVSQITFLNQTVFNMAYQKETGVDIAANYSMPVDEIFSKLNGNLSLKVLVTKTFHDIQITGVPGDLPKDLAGTNSANGPPKWRFMANATYDFDPFSLTLTGRGLSAGKYDNSFIECTSGCPTSTAQNMTTNNNHIAGAFYMDANLTYKFKFKGTDSQVYFNVRNVFNKDPAVVASGPSGTTFTTAGDNPTMYDVLGRMFRVGIRFDM